MFAALLIFAFGRIDCDSSKREPIQAVPSQAKRELHARWIDDEVRCPSAAGQNESYGCVSNCLRRNSFGLNLACHAAVRQSSDCVKSADAAELCAAACARAAAPATREVGRALIIAHLCSNRGEFPEWTLYY